MPRNARSRIPDDAATTLGPRLIQRVLADDSVPIQEKCEYLRSVRQSSEQHSAHVDVTMLRTIERLRGKLREADHVHTELEAVYKNLDEAFKRLTAPPLYPATFLEMRTIGETQTALVHYNNSPRFVNLGEGFDGGSLRAGDQALLCGDQNLLVGSVSCTPLNCGETALFDRYTADGRLVVSDREESVVVNAGGALEDVTLRKGDEIRWSRSAMVAYEKIERSNGDHLFLEEIPPETFDDIGGLDSQIEQLKNLVLLHLVHSGMTRRYLLPSERAALLEGPPGTGKTLMVKALVNFLGSVSPGGRARFMNVKPGEFSSMWYGQTEKTIRDRFAKAREAAEAEPDVPVIVFLDELDAMGSSRGRHFHSVDDRAVVSLAVELDGLLARGNVLVLGATNRRDILDPALTRPGRFGDDTIKVGRPNRAAARAILSKYLREELPYSNGNGPDASAREEILETALTRLFSSNGESDVVSMTFRDGAQRVIGLKQLLSGAVLAKIAHAAARRACLREIETGEAGIRVDDVLVSIEEEIDSAARILTPTNCSRYLECLPQDVDVVSVQPIQRKPKHPHRFLRVA
jgi:proteasome-associated ATPase